MNRVNFAEASVSTLVPFTLRIATRLFVSLAGLMMGGNQGLMPTLSIIQAGRSVHHKFPLLI